MLTVSWLHYLFLISLFFSLLVKQLKILSSLDMTFIMHFPRKPGEVPRKSIYVCSWHPNPHLLYTMLYKPHWSLTESFTPSHKIQSLHCAHFFVIAFIVPQNGLFLSCMKLSLYLSPRPGSRFISFKNISINCIIPNEMFSLFYILLILL